MFIHIGEDTVIRDSEIVGIFDMDNTTEVRKSAFLNDTVNFLNDAQKKNKVINVSLFELPKSFIICETDKGKQLYISPVAVSTIQKRISESKKSAIGSKKIGY